MSSSYDHDTRDYRDGVEQVGRFEFWTPNPGAFWFQICRRPTDDRCAVQGCSWGCSVWELWLRGRIR